MSNNKTLLEVDLLEGITNRYEKTLVRLIFVYSSSPTTKLVKFQNLMKLIYQQQQQQLPPIRNQQHQRGGLHQGQPLHHQHLQMQVLT